jgi:hypothetical protein
MRSRRRIPSDSALATRPKFETASGRTVYGGGGIYPDVIVHDSAKLTQPEIDMITKRAFFDYANARVQKSGVAKWTPAMLAKGAFTLDDASWSELRDAIQSKGVKMNDSTWTAEKPFVLHQLRIELASQTLGSLERYRIAVEDDTQLAEALRLFPRADALVAAMPRPKPVVKPGSALGREAAHDATLDRITRTRRRSPGGDSRRASCRHIGRLTRARRRHPQRVQDPCVVERRLVERVVASRRAAVTCAHVALEQDGRAPESSVRSLATYFAGSQYPT